MATSPENAPRQESEVETEKPRTSAALLTTRSHIGKLLNESLHSRGIDIPTSIRRKQSEDATKEKCYIGYLLEYGKDEALKYALNYPTDIEKELKIHEKITGDDFLKNDTDDIPVKPPQEIVNARIITGKRLDVAAVGVYLNRPASNGAAFYSTELKPSTLNAQEGIRSLEEFARVAGFYQGLSYLLGRENDGGMAKLIERSDPKDFRLPPHP